LAKFLSKLNDFLRALAADCNIETQPGRMVSSQFSKMARSSTTAEFQGDVSIGVSQIFARNLEHLADYDDENRRSET